MSNDLIEIFKKQLALMSYYNAAESDWAKEKEDRDKCSKYLKTLAKNLKINGIDPSDIAVGYLVSKSDYTE